MMEGFRARADPHWGRNGLKVKADQKLNVKESMEEKIRLPIAKLQNNHIYRKEKVTCIC